MVSIGLISNWRSGENRLEWKRYRENRRIKKFWKIIKDGDNGEVYVTGKSSNYLEELEQKVRKLCRDKPEVVAIDSGDGGISTSLTALERHWPEEELPPIVILKGGTFNILAKRLNIDHSIQFLENIAQAESANDLPVEGINLMRVSDDSKYEHLSFSTGMGIVVNLLEEAYQKKHLKNLRIAIMLGKLVGSAIVGGEYYQLFNQKKKLMINGEGNTEEFTQEGSWLGIAAHSVKSLGLPKWLPQPKLFRHAETEKRFHAVGTTVNLGNFLRHLPSIYVGEPVYYRERGNEEQGFNGNKEYGDIKPVLNLDKQLKSLTIFSEEPFKYHSCGELSLGYRPCLTRELQINSGRTIYFVKGNLK